MLEKLRFALLVVLAIEGAALVAGGALHLARATPRVIPVTPYCSVGLADVRCVFSNTDAHAVAAGVCVNISLVSKDGSLVAAEGGLCSGVLAPRETHVIAGPVHDRPVDACHDREGRLDWDECRLVVE